MPSPADFLASSKSSVADERLHRAIDTAAHRFLDTRAEVFAGFPDGEDLRERARALKDRSLAQLDELLEALQTALEKNGASVHWARNGAEARRIVLAIAAENRVSVVVKGKSMLSEEIELNEALEASGIEVVETDLGEYVVQLAGERPSHIITPAIHKSQQEIALLFHRRLGSPIYTRAEEIAAEARRALREKFLRAEMGVTGVNFAVAETGTLVVIENEGNGRMATTLPPVYVALLGIEKVIPSLRDLAPFLDLLPRSATGQKLTAYTSLISAPAQLGNRKQKMHVVLIDNGRSRILADPPMREVLFCLRCGACLNACPVYRKVGGHAYGYAYPGPIGAVLAPNLAGLDTASDLPFASTLCGACRDVCPVKIDFPALLLELRRRIAEARGKRSERAVVKAWSKTVSSPFLYRLVSRLARLFEPALRLPAVARCLPLVRSWYEVRELPRFAERRFSERWAEGERGGGKRT